MEPTEGRILIDNLDTSKIGLADLRSRLTIIPRARLLTLNQWLTILMRSSEDPTVLSGTLRSTLDVFGEYNDVDIVSSSELPFHIKK